MANSAAPRSRGVAEPLIKFCGLTRVEDARYAAQIGASYVGAIFAESPRKVALDVAEEIFAAAGPHVGHVVVFGESTIEEVAAVAGRLGADVVQLHGGARPADVERLRASFDGEIWVVVPVSPDAAELPAVFAELCRTADGLLLDAGVAGRSGGTGVPLAWARLGDDVARVRGATRLILAGGLNPRNVGAAVRSIRPAVVDVSSGVESSTGIKDHRLMLAFAEAVRSASIVEGRSASSSKLKSE